MALTIKNIKNIILCDEVRIENTNKPFIIGIYPSRVHVPVFPANVFFSEYFEIHDTEPGDYELYIRAYVGKLSKKNNPASIAVSLTLQVKEPMAINIPKLGLVFPEPSTFSVDISFDQIKWFNIIKRNIEQTPTLAASTVSPLPS